MRTSETTGQLAKAKAAAQVEMKNAGFDSVNPHFKNKYAGLAAVRDAVVPPLAKNQIALTQAPSIVAEMGFVLVTRLTHSSGEWEESYYPLDQPVVGKPQLTGIQIAYAKRYSLSSIAGIAGDDDDDGEATTKAGEEYITLEQSTIIQALVIEANADLPKFLVAIQCASIAEIPINKYNTAVSRLEQKIAATAKKNEAPDATGN